MCSLCIYNLDETMIYVRNPVLCCRLRLQQGIQVHIHKHWRNAIQWIFANSLFNVLLYYGNTLP